MCIVFAAPSRARLYGGRNERVEPRGAPRKHRRATRLRDARRQTRQAQAGVLFTVHFESGQVSNIFEQNSTHLNFKARSK